MNKNKIRFVYPILGTFACIFLCSVIWNFVKFTYSNPFEIIGEYSQFNHSIYNDTARYLMFILFPIATFFLIFYTLNKNNLHFTLSIKKSFSRTDENNFNYLPIKFLIFFIFFSFALFLTDEWNVKNYYLDIFEEGLPLSGATNSYLGERPWSDIHINTGLFYDILNAKIAWFVTGYKTIGSFKFYIKFLNLFSNLLLIYLLFELSKQINEEKIKSIFFVLISLVVLFINLDNTYSFRDIPITLFLISILGFLNTKKFIYLWIISFLSIFSLFWSLDKGFYLNLTLLVFLIFIFLIDTKIFLKNVLLIIIFWGCALMTVGLNDFLSFIDNTKEIFTTHEYFNGLIHPQPFSEDANSARATKSLILIIFNFIISILIFFSKEKYFTNNTKFFFIFFSIINFLTYKSALSRSDGGHIQVASYCTIILFSLFLIFFIFIFLNKKNAFVKKNILKNYLFVFFIFLLLFSNNLKSIKNIYFFPQNVNNLIKSNDSKFINTQYIDLINELKILNLKNNCLQAFTYDQAIFYLLQKKSCSKFFNSYVIGSKKNQFLYIDELQKNEPMYILVEGPIKFQSLNNRYIYVKDYIYKEYSLHKEIHFWKILKKN